jgi:hypothetical protein
MEKGRQGFGFQGIAWEFPEFPAAFPGGPGKFADSGQKVGKFGWRTKIFAA